ncbi:MAG: hypothetical protein J0H55_05455 [Chitinophagaceae bacterium]|nr:hypothetical protein [Chitinophagaceae bacterium]
MKRFNRELLVLLKEESNPGMINHEVEMLHEMLYFTEQPESMVVAHEIINVNKRKISSNRKQLKLILEMKELPPFVFLNNLN